MFICKLINMGNIRLFVFLTMSFIWRIDSKDIYLITTPNILLSETLHKFNTFVTTNAALIIESIHPSSNIVNRSNIIFLEKGQRSIPYFVPFIGPYIGSSLELRFLADKCASIKDCQSLTNIKGTFINESRQIDIIVDNFIIFSETDKPIYKPGDLVKLRAMAIYPTNLMLEPPSTGQYVEILLTNGKYYSVPTIRRQRVNFCSITIETPDNVKMAQWRNVSFEKAMRLNLSLSKDPMFGQWKITTVVGSKVEITYFIVKKYVLPRFVVEVYPPEVLLISDKNITIKTCAFYSTGKNMQALIKGEICVNSNKKICRYFSSTLQGRSQCNEVSINASSFDYSGAERVLFSSSSYVKVTVTENGTTHEVTKKENLPNVNYMNYEIKLLSKEYFKPGLPYFGILKLQRHDGKPQKNTKVRIEIESNFEYNWGFTQNYTSDNEGLINFVVPYIPMEQQISFYINGEEDKDRNGMLTPNMYKGISNWESVDKEYLQISQLKEKIKCPGTIQLELLMNGDVSSFVVYAQIISRGVIIKFIEYPPIPNKCISRNDHLGHYECAKNNQLKCLEGWKGINCREPLCTKRCLKGVCINPNQCSCKNGWTGKFCEKCIISTTCVNGYCNYGHDCQCHIGWRGYNCDIKGPKMHHYKEIPFLQLTTQAPKPEPKYQKQSIFEKYIDIPLEKNMGPDLHIVVYYINNNNEVIADSLEIIKGLRNCSHLGGGNFQFDKKTANPGEVVKITVDPNTIKRNCAVRISDVALSQFGQSSNINLGYLINKLTEINHKLTKANIRGLGFNTCWLKRKTKRSIIWPGVSRGYDSKKSFSQSGLIAVTNARIINAKCKYPALMYPRFFDNIVVNNRPFLMAEESRADATILRTEAVDTSAEIKKQIRDFFPETWVFDYYNVTPMKINLTVPDSMTSWEANSFCMTEKGIWIAPSQYLTVILPFFSDIYVPYSIKIGEKLQLPVKLFNYVDDCYEIRADIKVNSSEIKIFGPKSFTVCVCSNDVKTLYFTIEPKIMGKLNITIMAQSKESTFCSNGSAIRNKVNLSDNIRRQLLVEPPGIQAETTFSELICNNKEELGIKSHFSIPSAIVPGSLRSYLIYNGDVMGQTFDNLDNLVKMPYGCGEQNMVALVPSIYVLDYLTNLNIKDDILKGKAKKYIAEGYKRQLTYKHDDGSYSAFGKQDKSGSTWLTAFVVRSFKDASNYATIDRMILQQSVQYLEKMQQSNGCFKEQGKLFSSAMAGGLKSKGQTDEGLLTAYVLISLRNIKITKKNFDISKALSCVKSGLKETMSTYALALSGYVLSLYEPQSTFTLKLINQLNNLTLSSGRYKYWKSNLDSSTKYGPINSADVETTGYALLALQNFQTLSESLSTIYWLSNQRNSLGGYYSTQDTIVALKTVSVYAEKIGTTSFEKVQLQTSLNEKIKHTDLITASNRVVTRKVSLGSQNISYISIKTNGSGCISIQLASLYNIEKLFSAEEEFKLDVKASFLNVKLCTQLQVRICSSYLRKDRNSNMILITVNFPSGWTLSITERNVIITQIITPLKRIDFMENKLHLYYDSFLYAEEKNERCFSFVLSQKSKIDNIKSSFVKMMDYYKPEIYIDSSYEIPTETCKITNDTKPKPSVIIQCPKCFEDSEKSVSEFLSNMCPWSFTGLVRSSNNTLKNRLFYESSSQVFFEWTVNLEPSNCTCMKTWSYIKKDFLLISSQWLSLNENLTFNNYSLLFPRNVIYKAFKSDLNKSCSSAEQLSLMLSRLWPDFKNSTNVVDTCPQCILSSNLYYKVKNISQFICSNYSRWSLNLTFVNNTQFSGLLFNDKNITVNVKVDFSISSCYCLQQLRSGRGSLEIYDLYNSIMSLIKTSKGPLKLLLNNKFAMVEKDIFISYKNVKCNT